MFVKKKLSTKLHRVPFRVQYEKILSLEIFYTHAVADKYQVWLLFFFLTHLCNFKVNR